MAPVCVLRAGAFCVKVLKNEGRYIQRELASLQSQEKSLDELTISELEQAAAWDKHFMGDHVFEVLGLPVVVTGDLLAEASGAVSGKRFESTFYANPNLREVHPPEEPREQVPATLDLEALVEQLRQSPELANTLAALLLAAPSGK